MIYCVTNIFQENEFLHSDNTFLLSDFLLHLLHLLCSLLLMLSSLEYIFSCMITSKWVNKNSPLVFNIIERNIQAQGQLLYTLIHCTSIVYPNSLFKGTLILLFLFFVVAISRICYYIHYKQRLARLSLVCKKQEWTLHVHDLLWPHESKRRWNFGEIRTQDNNIISHLNFLPVQ
jgi:hypothetical protein